MALRNKPGDLRARAQRSLLFQTLGLYGRVDQLLMRTWNAVHNATEAALSLALTTEEKSALTLHLYDVVGTARQPRETLFTWELPWYQALLPPAPADILLTAAGFGREAHWLCAQGYRVFAFEPVTRCLTELQDVIGDQGAALAGDYGELCRAALSGEDNRLSSFCTRTYDAAILGWGSLSHVLEHQAQLDVLRAVDKLTPDGPILASFFLALEPPAAERGRAVEVGYRAGSLVARLRGLSAPAWHEMLLSHAGFLHVSTPDELAQLAAAIQRELQLEANWYGRASFLRAHAVTA